MDSSTVDPLNDTPTLPELSFDDLLDDSPVKLDNAHLLADPLQLNDGRQTWTDETLNTPGPKKSRSTLTTNREESILTKQQNIIKPATPTTSTTFNQIHSPTTPTRTNTITPNRDPLQWPSYRVSASAAPTSTISPKIAMTSASKTTTPPTLLNSKNILPKTTVATTNPLVKIAPKISAIASSTTPTAIPAAGNKTALKTANGQIYYLQKSTGGMSAVRLATPKTAAGSMITTGAANSTTNSAVVAAGGNKTVAIQVIRSADGTLKPYKPTSATTTTASGTATSTTSATKGAITLSPTMATQLAGKRIITNCGNKILIKAPPTTTAVAATTKSPAATVAGLNDAASKVQKTLPSAPAVTSSLTNTSAATKPTPKNTAGKIVVQSANGKHIVVTNPHLLKLSPKPTTPGGSGQLQAIHIPGKPGYQYVRVLPNSKISTASAVNGSPVSTAATIAAAGVAIKSTSSITNATSATNTSPASLSAVTSTSSSFKLLNNAPQKFTVVRTSTGTAKMMLTPSPKNFSPITSKVQKTIVTVPTLRKINDKETSPNINSSSGSLNIGSQQPKTTNNTSGICKVSLMQKHKISEINAQIHSMTGMSGPSSDEPETKKTASGNRIVVMSSSMLRATTAASTTNSNNMSMLQRTSVSVASSIQSTTGGITTVSPKKLFSVLKTGVSASDPATIAGEMLPDQLPHPVDLKSNAELKSLIICGQAQALMAQQQQHKAQQILQKQRQLQQQQQQLQQQMQLQRQRQQQQNEKQKKQAQQQQQFLKQQGHEVYQDRYNKMISVVTVKQEPGVDQKSIINEDQMVDTVVRRKHCNCTKSQCLKLYCDCFANGEFCQDCNCKDCFNNLQYEDERQKAIKNCLDRNPSAFKPKITTAQDQSDMRLHNKGCNCKRSGCLKNYCECYEAKIPCSSNCKCFGCRNIEDRPDLDMDPIDSKILATLANATGSTSASALLTAGQKRTYEKMDKNAKLLLKDNAKALANVGGGGSSEIVAATAASTAAVEKQQCNFITQEVIDATIQCMISQADECEKNGLPAYQTEKMVMEELGRCLVEIIDFSIRNTDTSYSQD